MTRVLDDTDGSTLANFIEDSEFDIGD